MLTISNIKYLFFIFLVYACQHKSNKLDINNDHLALVKGVMLYKEKPYSGILFSKTDTITTSIVAYKNGKKHGKEEKFFFDGNIAESRFYTNGKKSGTHRVWWNKNQLKSEYHFDDIGNYIGPQYEWYGNGQLHKELNYTNGKEDGSQKSWNITGQITANSIVLNGERFGSISSKKCNYVSDSK